MRPLTSLMMPDVNTRAVPDVPPTSRYMGGPRVWYSWIRGDERTGKDRLDGRARNGARGQVPRRARPRNGGNGERPARASRGPRPARRDQGPGQGGAEAAGVFRAPHARGARDGEARERAR